jgi:hypothetical protein
MRVPAQPLVDRLRALGLGKLAANLLEAAGPLNAVFAQLLYVGGPLLQPWMAEGQPAALAHDLEDGQAAELVAHLRGEQP